MSVDINKLKFQGGAEKLLTNFDVTEEVGQHLENLSGPTKQPLSADQVALALYMAMPEDQREHIDARVAEFGADKNTASDGTNKSFLSNVANLMNVTVEKDFAVPVIATTRQPPPQVTVRPRVWRDPVRGQVTFPKNAAFVAIVNASNVDENGVAPVIHMLERNSVKGKSDCLDLGNSRLKWDRPDHGEDLQVVENDASTVAFEDRNEDQFRAGDRFVAVPFDAKGQELEGGRDGADPENLVNVFEFQPLAADRSQPAIDTVPLNEDNPVQWRGDDADRPTRNHAGTTLEPGREVAVHQHKIRLPMIVQGDQRAQWTNLRATGLDLGLKVPQGTIYEPGADLSITIGNTVAESSTPQGDWNMPGNKEEVRKVDHGWGNMTYQQLMGQNSQIQAGTKQQDRTNVNCSLSDLAFGRAPETVTIGGKAWTPMESEDMSVADLAAHGIKAYWDNSSGSPQPVIKLDRGVLSASENEAGAKGNVQGWKIDVGYAVGNEWRGVKTVNVDSAEQSKAGTYKMPALTDRDEQQNLVPNGHVEIQLRNADGHMAKRIRIPMNQLRHG